MFKEKGGVFQAAGTEVGQMDAVFPSRHTTYSEHPLDTRFALSTTIVQINFLSRRSAWLYSNYCHGGEVWEPGLWWVEKREDLGWS